MYLNKALFGHYKGSPAVIARCMQVRYFFKLHRRSTKCYHAWLVTGTYSVSRENWNNRIGDWFTFYVQSNVVLLIREEERIRTRVHARCDILSKGVSTVSVAIAQGSGRVNTQQSCRSVWHGALRLS
jgi:hypothetical protein